jgi:hypothetical protein
LNAEGKLPTLNSIHITPTQPSKLIFACCPDPSQGDTVILIGTDAQLFKNAPMMITRGLEITRDTCWLNVHLQQGLGVVFQPGFQSLEKRGINPQSHLRHHNGFEMRDRTCSDNCLSPYHVKHLDSSLSNPVFVRILLAERQDSDSMMRRQ